jgi:hypothetical protein
MSCIYTCRHACIYTDTCRSHICCSSCSSDIYSRWKAPRASRCLEDVRTRRPGNVVADLIGTSTRDRDLEADGAAANQGLRPLHLHLHQLQLRLRLLHACLQKLQRPQRLRPLQLQALLQRPLLLPLRLRPRLRPCRLQRLRPLRLQRQLQALQWPLPPRPLQLPRQLEPRHVRQIRMWIPRSPWRWGGL